MNLSEVNWDFNEAGSWPIQIKISAISLVCALMLGGGIYQFTLPQLAEKEKLEKKEVEYKKDFADKQQKAINLEDYRAQLKDIETLLDKMIKQMPTKAEVAALLDEISLTALASGLDNELFKPEAEVSKDFYVEVPYKIKMVGEFEEHALFVSGLASLPRIVTVHNVILTVKSDGLMEMTADIKTYNEAVNEVKDEKAKKPKKG